MEHGRVLLLIICVLTAFAASPVRAQAPAGAPDAAASASAKPAAEVPAVSSEWINCGAMWKWVEYQCVGVKDAWHNGTPILYVTGLTYHDRATYSQEQLDSYNERSWGGGYGWGRTNDEGDHFGWYGLIFRDSHYKYTKMFGWSAMTYWPKQSDYAFGLGYTIFLGSRPDIYNSIPFPGILPLASVKLSKLELLGTYIPKVSAGTTGNGNVAFVFGRWLF